MTSDLIIDNRTGEIIEERDRAYYVTAISDIYASVVRLGVATGQALIEAKENLEHGEFEAMIESDLPFSSSTSRILMIVGRHPILSNREHVHDLPQSWGTLYELTKISIPVLKARIESGEINPNTTRKEAKAMHKTAHVSHNSGENEWYTPPEYIEAARAVMGGIDLDPASSDIANEAVKATLYYTEETDGLAWDWEGRVWMNPPYAQPLVTYFCDKLATDLDMGFITEAVTLTNNATETKWFRVMAARCSAICLVGPGRIKFIDKEGNPGGAPLQGQIVMYFGDNLDGFANEFGQFGKVMYAYRTD